MLLFLFACGKAYFPIEIKTISRGERNEAQEKSDVIIIPITKKNLEKANRQVYKRRVVFATDMSQPARVLKEDEAIEEVLPVDKEPGPYKLGIGDQITFTSQEYITSLSNSNSTKQLIETPIKTITRIISVSDEGYISLLGVGSISAEGKTQSQLEEEIKRKFLEKGLVKDFEMVITKFNSKKIYIKGEEIGPIAIKYTSNPIYLLDILTKLNVGEKLFSKETKDSRVTIVRGSRSFVASARKVYFGEIEKIRLFPEDRVYVSSLKYKRESVLVVGETGAQRSISIDGISRPSLADTIFSGNILNSVTSDFSQIYVIRENKSKISAFHLDITNPARINLASKFEMRPDDIVFVATQPLSLYSRTLSQILGSTGLTIQARDTIRAELGN